MSSTGFSEARADDLDDLVAARMSERQISALSLAIIDNGKIVKAKGYGFTDKGGKTPVTPGTLFQAASISKSLAALGALHLVEQGLLSLDADVNTELRSWKVPENEFTTEKKVTLRFILSHTAGFTVHGFIGYPAGSPLPTLEQVLDGLKPANSQPVRVDTAPGSAWRYSGGGYTVMQQMMIDATGKPFPEFLHNTVLNPLGMTSSTFEQPLPNEMAARAATGHLLSGKEVPGRCYIYPELAAAGLWTTPSDLARFAIGIQHSYAGDSNPVISQAMTREMLTIQKSHDGLGVFVAGGGNTLRFYHDGRTVGFDSAMIAYATAGKGAVIMLNANDNSGTMKDLLAFIAKKYQWPRETTPPVAMPTAVP